VTRELLFVQAINEALHLAMAADPDVIVLGEDVAGGGGRAEQGIEEAWGGIMGATKGLYRAFGAERVRDTPISEMGFLGASVGAALTGLRPVVELMFMDFIGLPRPAAQPGREAPLHVRRQGARTADGAYGHGRRHAGRGAALAVAVLDHGGDPGPQDGDPRDRA
jgi:hypothetical protein